MTGRLLSDFGKGDFVQTRRGRAATVTGFDADGVVVRFHDDGEEATLLPHLLELVRRAPRHVFPARFFSDGGVVKAMTS